MKGSESVYAGHNLESAPMPFTCFKFVGSLLFLLLAAGQTAFAADAMLFIQESPVTGGQSVYVTPKAMRIDNQKTGTTIICKAPKWEVDIYNKKNRTAFHTTADQFKASFFSGIFKIYRENFSNIKWKKEGVEQRDGVQLVKYGVHLDGKQGKLDLMDQPVRNAEYFVATNLKLPEKACNVLAILTSMPQLGGLPVQCTYYSMSADSASGLTTKVIKKVSVVDPFFEVYKFPAAASERDVFIDPTGRAAIEDFFAR